MCEMCKDYISDPYPLSGGRIARIRAGQDAPSSSDLVIAQGYILLPAVCEYRYVHLNPHLQFRDRLTIGGCVLDDQWGYILHEELGELTPHGHWRFCFCTRTSRTWREAMTAAWEYAHAELMKLEEALARRLKALEEAECSENMGVQTIKRKIQVKGG
jgi:hypothetical protein